MNDDEQARYDYYEANLNGDFGGMTDEQIRDYKWKIADSGLPFDAIDRLLERADRALAAIEQGAQGNA